MLQPPAKQSSHVANIRPGVPFTAPIDVPAGQLAGRPRFPTAPSSGRTPVRVRLAVAGAGD